MNEEDLEKMLEARGAPVVVAHLLNDLLEELKLLRATRPIAGGR